jgi:hypothetical protein
MLRLLRSPGRALLKVFIPFISETLGRDFEYVKTKEEEEREYQEEIEKAEDTSKLHKRAPEMKERLAHTKN